MAKKYDYALKEIPTGVTAVQVEEFLKDKGQNGWDVIQVVTIGIKRFLLAKKILVN